MNIRSETMLGSHHSWSITMTNLLLQFQNRGHKLYLKSIDGIEFIHPSLKSRMDREIQIPDLDIAYTMPRNFHSRFKSKAKKKVAIYNYESAKLPVEWINTIKYVDYVLPSSNFVKEVFINSGWPEDKCEIIPHGINPEEFLTDEIYSLTTKKKFRFLNISIPHYRKNIDLLVEAYYSAFSNQDDVCLVLKTNLKPPENRKPYSFEANVGKMIFELQKKYEGKIGGLPQIEIIQEKLPSIVPLYKSCDVLINAASSEGFGLPLLEGLAAGNLIIAPRCSGQLDFLNERNSLLVDVKEIEAGERYQYWTVTKGAKTYLPLMDDLADKMLKAYQSKEFYQSRFSESVKETVGRLTWSAAADKILELV